MTVKETQFENTTAKTLITFGSHAHRLLDNGYEPIPVWPGTKRPSINEWTTVDITDERIFDDMGDRYSDHQIGLRLGDVVAIDIDCLDESLASQITQICLDKLGDSPIRVGKAPKKMLFYKCEGDHFPKLATAVFKKGNEKQQVEILASGSQCVVFGTHPDTDQPYHWIGESIIDIPLRSLEAVTIQQITELRTLLSRVLEQECGAADGMRGNTTSNFYGEPTLPPKNEHYENLIKEALPFLDSEDYDTWIAVGHALKATMGEKALPIYQVWSSSKPDGSRVKNFVSNDDVASRFHSFKPSRTGLNSIFTKAARNGWTGFGNLLKGGSSHTSIARFLIEQFEQRGPRPVFSEGRLWEFTTTHWTPISKKKLRGLVQNLDGLPINKKHFQANKPVIDGTLNELCSMCEDEDFFKNPPLGINCQNGFIALDKSGDARLIEHSPSQARRDVLEVSWHQERVQSDADLLNKLFNGCFGGNPEAHELKCLVLQIVGVACSGATKLLKEPKAFICYGQSGANGKSEILNLVRAFLPKSSVAAVSPESLNREQHLATLAGKMANITDEIVSARAIASDKFKRLITGETVSAKEVYRPVFTFEPNAIHLFATNSLPTFDDGIDGGVKRRVAIIPFNRIIPKAERIPSIGKRAAIENGEVFLAAVVTELSRVVRSGLYQLPACVENCTEEWFQDSDPALSWLQRDRARDCLNNGSQLLIKHIYEKFRAEHDGFGLEANLPNLNKFSEKLRAWVDENPDLEIVRTKRGNIFRTKKLL